MKKARKNLLQVGDVIELRTGMRVYAQIPSCFIYSNRRDADLSEVANTDVCIGSALDNERGASYDTGDLAGRYVVTDTSFSGGGTQLSMSSPFGDHYPNGHQVFAQRLSPEGVYKEDGLVVSFYQTGCFTAMISPEEIQPVSKMRRVFVPIEDAE